MNQSNAKPAPRAVRVEAPARLHMGFLDPSGTLGRVFGGIGVGLNEISTRVILRASDTLRLPEEHTERCREILARVSSDLGSAIKASIAFDESIPAHVGLGSGTQLSLALALGTYCLYGLKPTPREVAAVIGRGRRSGIGIAVFENGGFIVDGGHGEGSVTPPLLSRLPFPSTWRFILVFDRRGSGLHGEAEVAAFKTLAPFPESQAAQICHQLLLRGLPALCEQDLKTFGEVITEIQQSIGDYFAPAQGGRFTSPDVRDALAWLQAQGAVGVGQTSWGPTGFCLVDGTDAGLRLSELAKRRFHDRGNLAFQVASACNHGARIVVSNSTGEPHEPPPDCTLDTVQLRTPIAETVS